MNDRVRMLRQVSLDTKPRISTERAEMMTEFYQHSLESSAAVRRAAIMKPRPNLVRLLKSHQLFLAPSTTFYVRPAPSRCFETNVLGQPSMGKLREFSCLKETQCKRGRYW